MLVQIPRNSVCWILLFIYRAAVFFALNSLSLHHFLSPLRHVLIPCSRSRCCILHLCPRHSSCIPSRRLADRLFGGSLLHRPIIHRTNPVLFVPAVWYFSHSLLGSFLRVKARHCIFRAMLPSSSGKFFFFHKSRIYNTLSRLQTTFQVGRPNAILLR